MVIKSLCPHPPETATQNSEIAEILMLVARKVSRYQTSFMCGQSAEVTFTQQTAIEKLANRTKHSTGSEPGTDNTEDQEVTLPSPAGDYELGLHVQLPSQQLVSTTT